MQSAKNLKCMNIFVQSDFSKDTLRKRKILCETAKEDKDNGKEAYLIHDKLKPNGTLFAWDDSQNCRVVINALRSRKTE